VAIKQPEVVAKWRREEDAGRSLSLFMTIFLLLFPSLGKKKCAHLKLNNTHTHNLVYPPKKNILKALFIFIFFQGLAIITKWSSSQSSLKVQQ
jgi:hypothetical protein